MNIKYVLLFLILTAAIKTNAQIIGSTDVCAGYIYTYSVNIAGAVTYNWTVPPGWYNLTGQSTSQITVTCNKFDGAISVEGFNPNGTSVGIQTLTTQFAAGLGWNTNPSFISNCAGQVTGMPTTSVTPNGTGGGAGCATSCGNGSLTPNIDYVVYDDVWPAGNFIAVIGVVFGMPFTNTTYYVYKIDYSAGYTPVSQAILIEGGCGNAVANNTIALFPSTPLTITFTQTPSPACVGDTVLIDAVNMGTYLWTATGATLLTNGISPVSAIVDSLNASIGLTGLDNAGCLNAAGTLIYTLPCLTNCLAAYYPLNGNYFDSSGNNLNAIWHGVTPAPDRFGIPNRAYHFNGISQWLELPGDFDFPKRTWSLWFYADTIKTGYHSIFDADHNGLQYAQTEMFLHESNGVDSLYMAVGDASTGIKIAVNEKQWYHVALVRDSTVLRYYFNGCLMDTVIINSSYNNHSQTGMQTVGLGIDRTHSTNYFKGSLDDIRVYQCALTDSEINVLADTMCNPLSIQWNENITNAITVFPNPANDFIIIKSNLKPIDNLQIYNATGQLVLEKKIMSSEEKISLKNFERGIYLLKVGEFKAKIVLEPLH